MTIGERIKSRRTKLDISIEELAEKLGKNRATIYRYESNEIENLPTTVLEPLAKVLKTTPSYLMGWEKEEAIDIFSIENIQPLPKVYKLPLCGSIACGQPIYDKQNIECYVDTSDSIDADYCLRCSGDSMINARIYDGDIVYIKKCPMVYDGEIAAIIIDDEATLKRVYYDKDNNKLMLIAENPLFPPMSFVNEELDTIHILGKAVCFTSRVR